MCQLKVICYPMQIWKTSDAKVTHLCISGHSLALNSHLLFLIILSRKYDDQNLQHLLKLAPKMLISHQTVHSMRSVDFSQSHAQILHFSDEFCLELTQLTMCYLDSYLNLIDIGFHMKWNQKTQ